SSPPPRPPGSPFLSLHDALPISITMRRMRLHCAGVRFKPLRRAVPSPASNRPRSVLRTVSACSQISLSMKCGYPHFMLKEICERSEEHTSELQSRGHLVCRLLLE